MRHLIALIASFIHLVFECAWVMQLLNAKVVFWGYQPTFAPIEFFQAHLVLSAGAGLVIYPFFKKRFKIPWHSYAYFIVTFILGILPLYGSGIIFCGLVYLLIYRKDVVVEFSTVNEDIEFFKLFDFGKAEQSREEIFERISFELETEPFIDILKGTDSELKKGVINKLVGVISPLTIQLLKVGLEDLDPEIRLMSTKALSKTEEMINDEIMTLVAKIKHDPDDFEAHNTLGNAYLRYATLGFLDPMTQKFYLQKVVTEYLISYQKQPKQTDLLLRLGHIFLLINNVPKAKEMLKRSMDINPDNYDAYMLYSDALLAARDIEALEKHCLEMRKQFKNNKDNEFNELVDYWQAKEEINIDLESDISNKAKS
jgi:tetratricopeptide (TPR) repeat protein